MNRRQYKGLRLGALGLAACVSLASAFAPACAQEAPQPAFKGSWPGMPPAPGSLSTTPPPFGAAPASPTPKGIRAPTVKHLLVLGGTQGWHHDSVPSAMAGVFNWGRQTHLWEVEMRTDFALVNPKGGQPMNAGFRPDGLRDFDAVVVASATGDWGLDATQKAALLQFVRDGGGLVVMHGGVDVHTWKDYTDMIGGEFVAHPFNNGDWPIFPFPIVNENASTPMTSFLPQHFIKQDEIYVVRNFSRDESEVLLSLDKDRLDFSHVTSAVPPSHDVPVTWIKQYGKGRVFVSTIGHAKEAFDDPEVARMYTEGIKWALHLSGEDAHPIKRK